MGLTAMAVQRRERREGVVMAIERRLEGMEHGVGEVAEQGLSHIPVSLRDPPGGLYWLERR